MGTRVWLASQGGVGSIGDSFPAVPFVLKLIQAASNGRTDVLVR